MKYLKYHWAFQAQKDTFLEVLTLSNRWHAVFNRKGSIYKMP